MVFCLWREKEEETLAEGRPPGSEKGGIYLGSFVQSIGSELGMAGPAIKSGALVALSELTPSSPYFQQGASLRVTGKLLEYTVETALAVVADGGTMLKIDTQHLRDLHFRIGSIYQFIGELLLQANGEAILQARVGRNVDGIDLNLYHQSILLLRQFQANRTNDSTAVQSNRGF